ncbi:hypothetical protein KP509_1Z046700 [Ceratopteris richardii]|nr:hypothetical protein KP509_1Z046700 [Ceratopteris richardii]
MDTFQQRGSSIYCLTSLQIGDIQSYVSKLYVYISGENLIFFVDNGPWSSDRSLRSKPVGLWQLMVTQSRMSPFVNQRVQCRIIGDTQRENDHDIHTDDDYFVSSDRWNLLNKDHSSMLKFFHDIFHTRLRSVIRMQELSHLLYGCVTFELQWKNIRGMNYVNELQTDTYMAFEVKLLVKRDFCDIEEASAFYGLNQYDWEASSMTSSRLTSVPENSLRNRSVSKSFCADGGLSSGISSSDEYFSEQSLSPVQRTSCYHDASDSDIELFDAVGHLDRAPSFDATCVCGSVRGMVEDHFLGGLSCKVQDPLTMGTMLKHHNDLSCVSFKEDSLVRSQSKSSDSHETHDLSDNISSSSSFQEEDEEVLLIYPDTLLIFRFCDPLLPFKLKEIITADQRLLKMLESGLPSWVIFLQSYPVFRKCYRPWMRPLAKTLYILVSITTVIIGFYDLYKNVPILKATAARICGPFFEWIEAWEMVSRIKYLGTFVFLQNWQKALRWLLLVFSTIRKLANLIFQPLVEPLEDLIEYIWPLCNMMLESVWGITSVLWMVFLTVFQYVNFMLHLLALPLIWLVTAVSGLATWILYPIIYFIWGFLIFPIRVMFWMVDFIVAVIFSIYKALKDFWFVVSSSFQIFSASGLQTGTPMNSSKHAGLPCCSQHIECFCGIFCNVQPPPAKYI